MLEMMLETMLIDEVSVAVVSILTTIVNIKFGQLTTTRKYFMYAKHRQRHDENLDICNL